MSGVRGDSIWTPSLVSSAFVVWVDKQAKLHTKLTTSGEVDWDMVDSSSGRRGVPDNAARHPAAHSRLFDGRRRSGPTGGNMRLEDGVLRGRKQRRAAR